MTNEKWHGIVKWNGKIQFRDENDELVVLDTQVQMERIDGEPFTKVKFVAEGLIGEGWTAWWGWGMGMYRWVQRQVRKEYIAG